MADFENEWKPDIEKKWYDVKLESYKFIFEQAKERMNDILSESESITNKSIKMISAIAAFLGFILALSLKRGWTLEIFIPFVVLVIVDIILLLILLLPKSVRWRGLAPKIFIPKNLDSEDDKEFQEQLLYYSAVIMLQSNIDYMLGRNSSRSKLYSWALIIFLVILIVTIIFVLSNFLGGPSGTKT